MYFELPATLTNNKDNKIQICEIIMFKPYICYDVNKNIEEVQKNRTRITFKL